ncbi:hypothetical protein MgSA37_04052 [Mucilaginibacter gotjawali]|uniref:Uncharacterized protein n=2 Tax=Mucilaginibacter gotjawali TaxID=1550579 RepID=A0A0X8X534_9SPHI|nr:hypothetical protein [Mucilaginibacter gotjawali]BAU55860.1 hypothetical protein MgSA37_04052 [Mucilaginibacter gotjawali]
MKHLLLYFLFFVGAAFIFIQCAKLFPTKNKTEKHQTKSQPENSLSNANKQNRTVAIATRN